MKQIALDSSLKKLSTDALTVQIGRVESPLASFLFVLSFCGESLGGRGFIMVLSMIFYWEMLRGKVGEIWRSIIANVVST